MAACARAAMLSRPANAKRTGSTHSSEFTGLNWSTRSVRNSDRSTGAPYFWWAHELHGRNPLLTTRNPRAFSASVRGGTGRRADRSRRGVSTVGGGRARRSAPRSPACCRAGLHQAAYPTTSARGTRAKERTRTRAGTTKMLPAATSNRVSFTSANRSVAGPRRIPAHFHGCRNLDAGTIFANSCTSQRNLRRQKATATSRVRACTLYTEG